MIEEILKQINSIKALASIDFEMAHDYEDSLRESFIKFIAKRNDSLGKMAKLILTTNDLNFPRHSS